jgi:hypothetical protein
LLGRVALLWERWGRSAGLACGRRVEGFLTTDGVVGVAVEDMASSLAHETVEGALPVSSGD